MDDRRLGQLMRWGARQEYAADDDNIADLCEEIIRLRAMVEALAASLREVTEENTNLREALGMAVDADIATDEALDLWKRTAYLEADDAQPEA